MWGPPSAARSEPRAGHLAAPTAPHPLPCHPLPRPHPEHRAIMYDLPAPWAADHHSQTPPPTAVPLRLTTPHRDHSSDELLSLADLKLVHHTTSLPPGPSVLHHIVGTGGIRPSRRPVPWERDPLPLGLGLKGQVGWELLAELAWLAP
jgi:hypothetical protein